jgi:hypothetical protein
MDRITRFGALAPAEEMNAVFVRDGEGSFVRTAAWHGVNLRVRPTATSTLPHQFLALDNTSSLAHLLQADH